MLKAVMLGFLALFLAVPFLFLDVYMHPICRKCGDNFNSKRLRFMTATAHCRRHGDFVIK